LASNITLSNTTCTARRSNGSPCRAPRVSGATVCQAHGGSAPQVIAAARRRLLSLVDPALGVLARAVRVRTSKRWEPLPTEIAAAREVLDRAGIRAGREAAANDGTVLWEEFVAIHRLRVGGDATQAVE
jgi:hypothetical protein